MIVVADASPLHYLVLIEHIAVLFPLYGQVIVPSVVCEELQRHQTPGTVRRWMAHPPPWLDMRPLQDENDPGLLRLGAGEECPTLALGFQDEVWWSRLAQPSMYAWTEAKPLRLVDKEVSKANTGRKALACYGLLLPQTDTMLWRFVTGRPVSQVTCDYLAWIADRMAHDSKKALVLIWDNASWHRSTLVRQWLTAHNQCVSSHEQGGGTRRYQRHVAWGGRGETTRRSPGGVHLHAMHTRRAIVAAHDSLRVWLSRKRRTSSWPNGASGAITMDRLHGDQIASDGVSARTGGYRRCYNVCVTDIS